MERSISYAHLHLFTLSVNFEILQFDLPVNKVEFTNANRKEHVYDCGSGRSFLCIRK